MATSVFQRQSYILEFVTCDMDVDLYVNGRHELKRRASKAVILALWIARRLHLPVPRKSWASIEDVLTSYGYALSPAYAKKKGDKLYSFYTVTHDVGIEIEDWPVMRTAD